MPAISMAVCIIPNFEQKSTKKVLYKHINNWVPAPCFAKASQGIGYDMQGFGQADFTDFVFDGNCGFGFYIETIEYYVMI
jgi:hypothetical protein